MKTTINPPFRDKGGSGGIDSLILNFGATEKVSGQHQPLATKLLKYPGTH